MRALLLALALAACSPAPKPPQALVGDAGGTCPDACSRLAALNCREGVALNCVPVCEHTIASRLTNLDVACISAATTVTDARACGVACR